MSTVTIACAAPSGIIIGQDEWNNPIKLNGPPAPANGLNVGFGNAGYGFTECDGAVFNAWLAANKDNAIVTSGAVWVVS